MSWLKWHIGTVDDPKFRVVSRKSRVTVRDVVTVWAAILECASQADDRGSIEGMDREAVTLSLELEDEQFTAILEAMQGRLLEGNRVINWGKRQTKSDDPTAAERKRRQRERERVTVSHDVTDRDTVTCHVDKIREEEIRKEDSYTGDFEECWAALPRRSGSNDKRAAFRAYSARLKEGHAPATILAGCKRYAAWCRHTGKVNTETVKQAATFFGPADPPHFAEDWRAPGQPAPAGEAKPLPFDKSLQPFAQRIIAALDVPVFNSWFAKCIVVEKEDWLTLAAPTSFCADYIKKNYMSHLRPIFGDQFQVGHGRPKVDA